ncbi:MAG: S8 family peptidase [Flavobacteriales bacterium]|jgi:hypothetical protein|nr:S8 family peptidase [Flavobacteriales bacterium]
MKKALFVFSLLFPFFTNGQTSSFYCELKKDKHFTLPKNARWVNKNHTFLWKTTARNIQNLSETLEFEKLPQTHLALDTNINDPLFPFQWELSSTEVAFAWDFLQEDSPNFLAAVVDGGNNFACPELQNYFINTNDSSLNGIDDDGNGFVDDWRGWDFAEEDNNASMDFEKHGFEMNAIMAAQSNNAIGFASAGRDFKYLHLKMVSSSGTPQDPYLAVKYAIDMGAQVINCSWYQMSASSLSNEIIAYAQEKDVLLIAAAGNSDKEEEVYPASYPSVLAVGAVNQQRKKLSSSNYGKYVDIYAPGHKLTSAADTNSYLDYSSGTSAATAFTSSSAILLRKIFPEENAHQIKTRMILGALRNPLDEDPQAILLNLKGAIELTEDNNTKIKVLYQENPLLIFPESVKNKDKTIDIYDSLGRLLHQYTEIKETSISLNNNNLKGIVFIRIHGDFPSLFTKIILR